MKKMFAACICLCFTFSLAGCSLGPMIDRFVSAGDAPAEAVPDKPRVYMDELTGVLCDFDGHQVTVQAEEELYVFDVSGATLECSDGMISGDEISVIYEGRLTDTDTTAVKALKVVDEYYKKSKLKNRTIQGTVLDLTPNTMTIRSKKGKTVIFPITGTEQYYQNGIQKGSAIYLHYKGTLPDSADGSTSGLNASHLKVLTISDVEPFAVPEPTPTPAPDEAQTAVPVNQFFCAVHNISQNMLEVVMEGTNIPLKLDISAIPCYFPGGIAQDSHVTIFYTGEFNGTTLEGLTILGITGENPASQRNSHISFRTSGTVIGKTANTVTIRTGDMAVLTFATSGASNTSTGGLEEGCSIRITFNPAASRKSNIFSCLRIEDA